MQDPFSKSCNTEVGTLGNLSGQYLCAQKKQGGGWSGATWHHLTPCHREEWHWLGHPPTDSAKLNEVKQWISTPVPTDTDSKAVICSRQRCTLLSVSVWAVEVPSTLPSYFQVSVSNAREISLKYGLALSNQSVCGVESWSPCLNTAEYSVFALF